MKDKKNGWKIAAIILGLLCIALLISLQIRNSEEAKEGRDVSLILDAVSKNISTGESFSVRLCNLDVEACQDFVFTKVKGDENEK